jgi:hypothetical protein
LDYKATYLTLCDRILDLLDFNLTEALDLKKTAASGCMHGGDSEVTVVFELYDVGHPNAMCLQGFDVDDLTLLLVRLSVMCCSIGNSSHTSLSGSSLAIDEGMLSDMTKAARRGRWKDAKRANELNNA